MFVGALAVAVIVVGIAAFEIQALLRDGRKNTLIWFLVIHLAVSAMVLAQSAGVRLPNPSLGIERVTTTVTGWLSPLFGGDA